MALQRNKILNGTNDWDVNRRYKVNAVVSYLGGFYQNISGKNTSPSLGTDWFAISLVSSNLKIASKASGNYSSVIEIGDIVYGLLNDNVTFIPFGKYLGGNLQDVNSYMTNPIEFTPV